MSPTQLMALQRLVGNQAVARMVEEARHVHGAGCGHGEAVQRSSVQEVLRAPGRPLEEPVRAEMEARLGADFGDVRVHTDPVAQRSAMEIGARAYTSGSHVVIGQDGADRHTLAHELTHVIQQRSGPVAGTDNGAGLRISDPGDRFERAAEANARQAMSGPAPVQRVAPTAQAAAGPAGAASVQRAPSHTYDDMEMGGYSYSGASLSLCRAKTHRQSSNLGFHVIVRRPFDTRGSGPRRYCGA